MPMSLISVHIPKLYVEMLDELVRRNKFKSRGEAIRLAVRNLLKEESMI